jgi:hypothetical protein
MGTFNMPVALAMDDLNLFVRTAGGDIHRLVKGNAELTSIAVLGRAPWTSSIYALGADEDHVYWDVHGPPSLNRAPLQGGAPESLTNPAQEAAYLTLNSTHVYFVDAAEPMPVMRVPKAGGAVEDFYAKLLPLVADDEAVLGYDAGAGSLVRVPLDGTMAREIAWPGRAPQVLLLAEGRVLWTESTEAGSDPSTDGAIYSVSQNGGDLGTLVMGLRGLRGADVYSGQVFFMEEGDHRPFTGGISSVPVSGGSVTSVNQRGADRRYELGMLRVDGNRVYWISDQTVMSVAR